MTNRKAQFELLIIAAVAFGFAILELYIDSFVRFVRWAAENESLLATELFTLAIVLSIGLSIYAWRRWREAVTLEADKARLQKSVSAEKESVQLVRSYADAIMQGQEAERRRLARELHDDTIQRLIVLNQRVELAAFDHANSEAAADLEQMQMLIGGIIGDVRRFVQELRPTYLDELGLVAALGALIKSTRGRTDMLLEFMVEGEHDRLSEEVELALYRIVQSGLANIIQHAEATAAQVLIKFEPSRVHLTIEDDGVGFAAVEEKKLVADGHFGLIGMRERAVLLGATYGVVSVPDAGTKITVDVPLK